MAAQINTADYKGFNDSINQFLSNGKYKGTTISIYSDESATTLVTDDNGPIDKRQINSVTAVYSYIDQITNENVNGKTTIQFTDGSSIVVTDNVDQYWYLLSGIDYSPKKFG